MESPNLIKDYGKEEQLHNSHYGKHLSRRKLHGKRLLLYLAAAATLVGALILAMTLARFLHSSTSKGEENQSLSIQRAFTTVCNVTLHPTLCISTLSSSWNSSVKAEPQSIFKLSLRLSSEDLANITAIGKTFSSSNTTSSEEISLAVKDCLDLLDDASDRVKNSLNQMEVVGVNEKVLNSTKISNIRTWVSAAMADEETCFDGLKEASVSDKESDGSFVGFKKKIEVSQELLSNSLAIISHLDNLLIQFGLQMY